MTAEDQATDQQTAPPLPPGYEPDDVTVTGPSDPKILQRPTDYLYTINGVPVYKVAQGPLLPPGKGPAAGGPQGAAPAAQPEAPLPAGYEEEKPGVLEQLWQEGVVNPSRQVGAGIFDAAAGAQHITSNVFDMLDKTAQHIANLTGTTKGDAFKNIADWAKANTQGAEQTAQDLSGGRRDIGSQIFRGLAAGTASLPMMGVASTVGGPVGGFATLGALEQEDKGFLPALEGAVQGGLLGGTFHVLSPAGQVVKLPLNALIGYTQARMQGADPKAAIANATTMALLPEVPSAVARSADIAKAGGAALIGAVRNPAAIVPRIIGTGLNPAQQRAVQFFRDRNISLGAGVETGNAAVQGAQALAESSPLGFGPAGKARAATQEGMEQAAGELAARTHPEDVTPETAGGAVAGRLGEKISVLNAHEQQSYGDAWKGMEDPQYAETVQVGTEQKPMLDAKGKPTGTMQNVPVMGKVQMPVDIRWLKEIAKEELPYLENLPAAEQAQKAAVAIFKNSLKLPDHVSARMGEEMLKGFKGETREAESPDLQNYSQGQSARVIPRLQEGVDAAVAKAGPEKLTALREGRQTHAMKMEVAELARQFRKEPVQTFQKVTWGRDTNISFLREIESHAPGALKQVGRAFLRTLFDKAAEEGGFAGSKSLLNRWNDLGPETKKLLFPDPKLRGHIDDFFLGARMYAEKAQPSKTALVGQTALLLDELTRSGLLMLQDPIHGAYGIGSAALYMLGGRAATKLFYSPRGIRLLTGAMKPESPQAAAWRTSELLKIAGDDDVTKLPPEEPPSSPSSTGGPPLGGAPPSAGEEEEPAAPIAKGVGSLQEHLQNLGDEAFDRVRKSGIIEGRISPSLFPAEVSRDMITWGAARIANGAIDLAKFSKAMLADAADIGPEAVAKVRGMMPQLWADSQKEYEHHLKTFDGNIADLPQIMKYYRAGKEGKNWYNFVRPALQPLFGQHTDLFLKMFAATSPNTKVTQNVVNAVKAYRQFLMGEPFTGMQAHVDNLNRAVAGIQMSGPKVGAFGPNLMGNLTPVTVDLWMARALLGRDTVTPLQSKLVDYMTSQAAKKVGLEPAEMQAAIWTGVKKLWKSRDTSAPPEQIVNEYLDKNPDVRKLFEESLQMSKERFRELQTKQAPAKPPR